MSRPDSARTPDVPNAPAVQHGQFGQWWEIGRLVKEYWAAYPLASAGLLVVLLTGNARVGLYLLAMGGLVDALMGGAGRAALLWAAVYVAADALEQAYWPVKNALYNVLQDHSASRIQRRVLERAASAPLIQFEEREFFDHLQRASSGMGERLARVSITVVDTGQVLLMFASTALVLLAVQPLVPLLLALGTLPSLWFQLRVASVLHAVERAHTTRDRIRKHLQSLLTGREAAAEVRLFGAAPYLLARWSWLRAARGVDLLAAEQRRTVSTTAGSLIAGVAYAAALGMVAVFILRGQVTVGGYVMVAGGALTFQGLLGALIGVLRALQEESRFLGDLFDFLRVARVESATPATPTSPTEQPDRLNEHVGEGNEMVRASGCTVEASGLTFAYPGSQQPVLRDVSLRIAPGERIAIVGENGAGKTTLVKLLIGLYRPDAGTVRLDGLLLTPENALRARQRMAAVFQDYAAFQLTVRENVGFGNVARLHDDAALARACDQAGIADLVAALPHGLDSYLGRQFGETDLSGGQWQRVALARASLRDADLLVLDEPTAALDPLAELALFERFAELTDGRTALMISHRLGAARLADRVIVLRDGAVVEDGPHDALIRHGGEYARLFAAQAQWYR